jgi:hypothetical protein
MDDASLSHMIKFPFSAAIVFAAVAGFAPPAHADSQLDRVERQACEYLRGGGSPGQFEDLMAKVGVSRSDTHEILVGAARTYCPDQLAAVDGS